MWSWPFCLGKYRAELLVCAAANKDTVSAPCDGADDAVAGAPTPRKLVLCAPAGAAAHAGLCGTMASNDELERRGLAGKQCARSGGGPEVLCGDGVCRHTFAHCLSAMAPRAWERRTSAPEAGDALRALMARGEGATLMLRAVASFDNATRRLFPTLCEPRACARPSA